MNAKVTPTNGEAEASLQSDDRFSAPTDARELKVSPPNIKTLVVDIIGTAPYVQNAFGPLARAAMMANQQEGSTKENRKNNRTPKNFNKIFKDSTHFSTDGWPGIPVSAFRAGVISSCRLVGFKMTLAKLAISIVPEGFDSEGIGLVKILGPYKRLDSAVTLADGSTDIKSRPMWDSGWKVEKLTFRFDRDTFTKHDVANLIDRTGKQIGIGAGRNDSKKSVGVGWGFFETFFIGTDDLDEPGEVPNAQ